jgi:hypothetical protein
MRIFIVVVDIDSPLSWQANARLQPRRLMIPSAAVGCKPM